MTVAIEEGNVRERAAKIALRELLDRLSDAVAVVQLPGRGQPVGYRLKSEENTTISPPVSQQDLLFEESGKQLTNRPPPEILTLHQQLKAGTFAGQPELESELGHLFGQPRADADQRARLLELARGESS